MTAADRTAATSARTAAAAGTTLATPATGAVSDPATLLNAGSPQRVRRASGLLAAFNDAGVLGAADVHVALRLQRLGGEDSEAVLLAVALTVRALRHGSVCLDLATAEQATAVEGVDPAEVARLAWPDAAGWTALVAASPLVATGDDGPDDRPLRLAGSLLYLDRYWRQEHTIAAALDEAAARLPPTVDEDRLRSAVARLFPAEGPDRQRLAAVVAARRWVSVLAGGPGTGKTTTVAQLLAVLADQPHGRLRVALAAPTGKAAARLTEAVAEVTAGLAAEDRERLGTLTATTLHRLLGWRPGARGRFRHDRTNRLPFDVVVVDEASMVSLTLMSRLVEAVRSDCRLVLVGDPDQLASVEAGAVLGDLVAREAALDDAVPGDPGAAEGSDGSADLDDLDPDERAAVERSGVVRLAHVHRFAGAIAQLAAAVRSGDVDAVAGVLDAAGQDGAGEHGVELVDLDPAVALHPGALPAGLAAVREDAVSAGVALVEAARAGDAAGALDLLGRHRLLCAHREGPYGVARWSLLVEEWLRGVVAGYGHEGRWYAGRPLLVTSNDYGLRLFNGDTGVVVEAQVPGGAGGPGGPGGGAPMVRAAFRRDGVVETLPVSRLSDVQTVHAMSVHRSQGSQFERVTLVLPPADSPLLTRELVYTAVTRARTHVRVVGTREALLAAVERPITRASGLRRR